MPTRRIPFRLGYAVGFAWEALHRVHLAPEPQITRLHCRKTALSHAGSIVPSTRDFGYVPPYAWRAELEACVPYCREVYARMKAGRWP